jgi:ankyrin repeat protein
MRSHERSFIMTSRQHSPTRTLRDKPDLAQLKRQAKELLQAFAAGESGARSEVNAQYHGADPGSFALHDAQLVLARSYGFDSWPKLKAFVDGVTVRGLCDAVRAGDVDGVRAMLAVRPELVHLDLAEDDEHRALHHAVLQRRPEMVRLLMQHGADARKGIWPHRGATSPLTMATERGYADLVTVMRDEERRYSRVPAAAADTPVPDGLRDAFRGGDQEAMIASLDAHPSLIQTPDPQSGMTALHLASANLWDRLGAWLIDRGADVSARNTTGQTPLDLVGSEHETRSPERARLSTKIASLLLGRGAERTLRWAIATGDGDFVRTRHLEGGLTSHHGPPGATRHGLVTHAVKSERPDMLALLLDLGLDADERVRVDGLEQVVYSWGEPLRQCAILGELAMAEILLERGASANTNVYAASSAMYEAYTRQDRAMVELLERHGGFVDAGTAGYLGLAERLRRLFEDEAAGRLQDGVVPPGSTVAEELLFSAAASGNVDLVQMALGHLDWPRGDARWQGRLMQPFGRHSDADRDRYLTCFQMILERSGVDLPSPFGRTLLHDVAAAWPRSAPMGAEERIGFATILLDAGARLDVRDDLLGSTPLGWACRWGRVELVTLLLHRGADPVEADAEPWATPLAWAEKMNHGAVRSLLRKHADL